MRRLILTVIAVFAVFSSVNAADLTKEDVQKALSKPLTHPYLFFTEADKSSILERLMSDAEFGDIFRREQAEASRLLYTPIDRNAPKRYTNARFEGTYEYESFIMRNVEAAYRLAFVYQMTGDRRYADKAFEFADVVCDQPTWIHSAHEFPDIYDRVWPWGVDDDQPAFGFSQHADHYVFRLAAVYDWLYPALDKRSRDRIRGALLEKAILRVRGNYEYHWWAGAYRCNWCSVCNASLGVASLALINEDPQLVDVVAESWNRISRNLDEIKTGGWQEGMGYLAYTIRTSLTFADALKRTTGGALNLYEHPRYEDALRTLLYCRIPPDKSVHFGDSGGGNTGSYQIYNECMLERDDKTAAWLMRNASDSKPSGIGDLFKPRAELSPALPSDPSILFPSVNWVILRNGFNDTNAIVIAAKCGMNDDPHHGHLDAGHFSLYWKGCEFICDHGSAGYDKEYFDEARWSYPLASTGGHNCVTADGEQQLPCKLKNKPWDMRYGGKIIEFRPSPGLDYVLMDPSNAYFGKKLSKWRRHIILDKKGNATVVLDEIEAQTGSEIDARFHSAAKQTVRGGYVLLENGGDTMALIPVSTKAPQLREGRHPILLAQRNARFRWVPYVDAVLTQDTGRTLLATVIVPVKDDAEAARAAKEITMSIEKDGSVRLSYKHDGSKKSYRFKAVQDGVVLE